VNPRLLLALFLTGLFAIGAAAYAIVAGEEESPDVVYEGFAGSTLPDGVRAPAFDLIDEREDPIAMSDFRGEPVHALRRHMPARRAAGEGRARRARP
jgi:hypothetical protein